MASRLAGWALKATTRGARFASSSAAPVRAFPIFGRSRGVVESNDLYIHHVVTDTSMSLLQQKVLAEHARAERAAEVPRRAVRDPDSARGDARAALDSPAFAARRRSGDGEMAADA